MYLGHKARGPLHSHFGVLCHSPSPKESKHPQEVGLRLSLQSQDWQSLGG